MSDKPRKWKAEKLGEAWVVIYDPTPGGTKNDDGAVSFSLPWPAIEITEFVSEPQEFAQELAQLLNDAEDIQESGI